MAAIESSELQELANMKDATALQEAADATYAFDTEDPFQTMEVYESGVDAGLNLAAAMLRKRKRVKKSHGDPSTIKIFKLTFNDYGDGDGLVFFVGTEAEVRRKIKKLPKAD